MLTPEPLRMRAIVVLVPTIALSLCLEAPHALLVTLRCSLAPTVLASATAIVTSISTSLHTS